MKADSEKKTKICSKCKRELPIEMFSKDKSEIDGLKYRCKDCDKPYSKIYYNKNKVRLKEKKRITYNTFGRIDYKHKRGNGSSIKRDYELSDEELKRRNRRRKMRKTKRPQTNVQSILVWYDGKLEGLSIEEYAKALHLEYNRQKRCAIRGYIGKVKPSEHFLFDFDLEQMLKDKVYLSTNGRKLYITKWWKGEIRHWTVNDGIWKE